MQPVLNDWRLTSPLLRGNCSNGKHGSVSCRCTTRPAALLDCGGKVCNITTWMSEPDSRVTGVKIDSNLSRVLPSQSRWNMGCKRDSDATWVARDGKLAGWSVAVP